MSLLNQATHSRITQSEEEPFCYIDNSKKSTMGNKDFNLVIVCGAPASGKMTVGQEVQKLTDYDYCLRPFRAYVVGYDSWGLTSF